MRQVYRFLAYPVMVAAALGVLASFFLAVISFGASRSVSSIASRFLFPGIFVVWLPTILFANLLIADFKHSDLWRASLRGCPTWMRTVLWVIIAIVSVGFFAPFIWGRTPGDFKAESLIFPSSFYAISFCVAYSFLHVEKFDAGRRCLNGHPISPLAKFCEECGAPSAPEGAPRSSS